MLTSTLRIYLHVAISVFLTQGLRFVSLCVLFFHMYIL